MYAWKGQRSTLGYHYLEAVLMVLLDRVLLCNPVWPGTHRDLPASASQAGLKVWATQSLASLCFLTQGLSLGPGVHRLSWAH